MDISITLVVAILGWKIAERLKLSAPAMLGSMIAVGLSNYFFEYAYLPGWVKIFAQGISGAYIGMQITKKDLYNTKYLIKPFLFLVFLLTLNTFVMGLFINKYCGLDLVTSLLSCISGGVTSVAIIAMEMDANAGIVALMQTSRLISVLLLFPFWIKWMSRNESPIEKDTRLLSKNDIKPSILDKLFTNKWQKIIFTISLSLLVSYLGQLSGIPAATMVFPMFVIALFNCTTTICVIPFQTKVVAQLLAGALVGTTIHSSTFSNLGSIITPVLLLLISYWFINFIFSYFCRKWKWLDLKSAMLASAPGGATDMSLIASDLGADLTKIAFIQVMRSAYSLAIMPQVITLFIRLVY